MAEERHTTVARQQCHHFPSPFRLRCRMTPDTILNFWFSEINPPQWWRKDPRFDAMVADRFGTVHGAARAGELFAWRTDAPGRLAEILVLDQFSRNMYRNQPAAFAADPQTLALAQEAITAAAIEQLPPDRASFVLLPVMHSESLLIHDAYADWFKRPGFDNTLASEHLHRQILERFGRYPHRNAILGRVSTVEEAAFLLQPGSSF
jgi:uncharacterized protein (DUF924 family)